MGWLSTLRRGDPNVVGRAYALTMFTAILPGREDALEAHLSAMPMADRSPWSAIAGLHFIRLHVVRQFVHQGPSQKPDRLENSYLVTDANVDGGLDGFVRDLCATLPAEIDAIYGHCVGFPGSADPQAVRRWVGHNSIDNGVVLTAYPEATLPDVRAALALRERVANFASKAHLMDAETLQRAFRETFGTDPTRV